MGDFSFAYGSSSAFCGNDPVDYLPVEGSILMNIIQISDLHLCENDHPAFQWADSTLALRNTVDYFLHSSIEADAVVVSGDISNDGSIGAYQTAKDELDRLPWPVYYIPGNHDDPVAMQQMQMLPRDPYQAACRRLDFPEAVIILLNSAHKGLSSGYVSNEALKLLKKYLSEDDGRPTFLFMHHVPFRTGYTVMDEPFEQAEKLMRLLAGRQNLLICCGHIHASIVTKVQQVSMNTCPPVCMAMEFDLTSQGGDMFYTSEPQFTLYVVEGSQVVTHFATVPTGESRRGPYTFSV